MTEVILHIGHAKTGTTSIQNGLVAMRSRLADIGVLYPETPHIPEAHHAIAAFVSGPGGIPQHVLDRMGFEPVTCLAQAAEDLAIIRASVQEIRPASLILSSESFYRAFDPEQFARLRHILASLAERVRILAYIRNPADRYLSRV